MPTLFKRENLSNCCGATCIAGFCSDCKEHCVEEGVCIGCGGVANRTNNTLCSHCWVQAEGMED